MEREKDTRRHNYGCCYNCGKKGHYARHCWYKKQSTKPNLVASKEMGSTSSPNREEQKRDKMVTHMASWKLSPDMVSGKKGHHARYCWREKKMGSNSFPDIGEEQEDDEGVKGDMMLAQMVSWMLPQDVTFDILSRIPVKSVMRCRCVCKAWRGLLKSHYFIDMHFARSSKAENPTLILTTIDLSNDATSTNATPVLKMDCNAYLIEHMLELGVVEQPIVPLQIRPHSINASCNGLLCLSSYFCNNDNPVLIRNPFTQETVELPRSNIPYEINNVIYGFGYHSGTKEYKVLSFVYACLSKDSYKTIAEVFTLGSSTWRSKGDAPFSIMWRRFNVLVNGALHWLAYQPVESDNVVIAGFDIGNEEFYVLPIPPKSRLVDKWHYKQIQELGGFLSLVDFSSRDRVDIWIKKHYGVEESWSKQFVVPIHELVEEVSLLWHLEGGEIVLDYNGDKFISYDPNNGQIRQLNVQVPDDRTSPETRIIHTFVHVGSLVSPRVGV